MYIKNNLIVILLVMTMQAYCFDYLPPAPKTLLERQLDDAWYLYGKSVDVVKHRLDLIFPDLPEGKASEIVAMVSLEHLKNATLVENIEKLIQQAQSSFAGFADEFRRVFSEQHSLKIAELEKTSELKLKEMAQSAITQKELLISKIDGVKDIF